MSSPLKAIRESIKLLAQDNYSSKTTDVGAVATKALEHLDEYEQNFRHNPWYTASCTVGVELYAIRDFMRQTETVIKWPDRFHSINSAIQMLEKMGQSVVPGSKAKNRKIKPAEKCDACDNPATVLWDSQGEGLYWLCDERDEIHNDGYCGVIVSTRVTDLEAEYMRLKAFEDDPNYNYVGFPIHRKAIECRNKEISELRDQLEAIERKS